ncbi:MAG: T9SS type A sorting domain-containing protein [Flavipsychrobacter sp.]|nr:T9SS type A sorting domain-containing protein [Flavipsychrobacter sp.]
MRQSTRFLIFIIGLIVQFGTTGRLFAQPIFSAQPTGSSVCLGSAVTTLAATTNAATYQWYLNNVAIGGATSNSYSISSLAYTDTGMYFLAATNLTGTTYSDTVNVSILAPTTAITSSPSVSTHICFGGNSTISGLASGANLSYQWYANTGSGYSAIADNWLYNGSASSSLQISNVISVMNGYQYLLTATGTCGSANTTATTLTVDTTIITSSPAASTHICFGGSSTISGSASGPGLGYQWLVNKGSGYAAITDDWNYSGAATSSLQISNVITAMTGYQYKLAVTGTCSAVFTTPTTLTVDTTIITSNPPTRSHICFGGNSSIIAAASGPGLVYQWTANTGSGFVNLSDNATYTGTHTNTLHIINSDFSFGGYQYQLNVTGTCGAASTIVTTAVVDSFPQPITFNPNYNWALQGQVNVIYSTNLDTDVNYVWAYSGSAVSIANSGDTARYTYGVTATSGNVSVFAMSPYGCGTTSTISQGITVYPYDIWTGDSSKNWNDTNNWDRHIIPYGTISAYIPTILTPLVGIMDTPEISTAATNACYRLYMDANSGLTIDAGLKLLVNSDATLLASVQGSGILSFSGSSAQTITASDTVYNLEINNSHGVTIPPNSRIHIKYNFYPTAGTFTNNGTVFLISDANGTATVNAGSSAGGYITGTAINVQKYIHGGRRAYRFLAHPFSSSIALSQLQSAFDITGHGTGFTTTGTNNPSAFWYNTVTANGSDTDDVTGWIPYTSTDGTGANAWNPYEGLRIMVRGVPGEGLQDQPYMPSATTINMYGQLTQGDHSVPLTTNTNKGYNFVANPYAASIDLSTLTMGSSIGPNFWVWDPNQGLAGAYVSQPLSVPYVLPAYSSFVLTATAATNNTVGFHESSKTTSAAANLFKTTGSSMGYDMLQLHILSDNNATSWDRLLIYFRGDATAGTDAFDAAKWSNDDLNFYTYSADNKQQSIDVRPYVNGQVIQLGVDATQQKTYSMSVDDFNMDPNVKIYLHDKYLKMSQLLSQGYVYNFTVTSDANSQGSNRFELNQVGEASGIGTVAVSGLTVAISPNPTTDVAVLTYTAAVKGTTSLHITNIMGQQVYGKELGEQKGGSVEIPVADLAAGIYLVNLKCGAETIIKRLVKQ